MISLGVSHASPDIQPTELVSLDNTDYVQCLLRSCLRVARRERLERVYSLQERHTSARNTEEEKMHERNADLQWVR